MIARVWPWFWRVAGAVRVRWKIMGIVVAVILLLGGSVTYELAVSYKKTLQTQVEEKGLVMSRSLAARSANLVLTNQRFALFELAKEIQKSSEDVEYVYVVDGSGQPVVDTFGNGFPRDLLSLPQPGPSDSYRVTRMSTEVGLVQDIAVPILQGRGGFTHVGMSEARIQGYVSDHVRTNLFIILGVLVVGAAGAFGLATILTRPVEKLVEVTEAIGRGEFDKTAPVWATDEIGRLGIAFNSMAGQLRQSSEALLQRNRDLEGLNAVASAANRSDDAPGVMNSALAQVLNLTNARAAWISLLDDEAENLQLAVQAGLGPEEEKALASVGRRRCPCITVPGASDLTGAMRLGCAVGALSLPPSLPPSPIACVPLRSQGRPLGVLNLAHLQERDLDLREQRLLLAIGDQVSVALENTRLVAELRRKEALRGQLLEKVISAQEDERKRISRELHDETGQALTALSLGLKSLESLSLPDGVRVRLSSVRSLAATALHNVHDLAIQLRPSVLDEAGLAPAIDRYVRGFTERYDIPADLQVTGMKRRLAPATETALYRITQEALTNVARHAQASHVSVLLERRNGTVLLLIEDDGRGFSAQEPETGQRERLGIHGMEERATLVGGSLTIESRPGAGTSVYAEIPVTEGDAS